MTRTRSSNAATENNSEIYFSVTGRDPVQDTERDGPERTGIASGRGPTSNQAERVHRNFCLDAYYYYYYYYCSSSSSESELTLSLLDQLCRVRGGDLS